MRAARVSIELHQLALFALAFAMMVASPGPFVAAIAARSMASGFPAGAALATGGALGDTVYVVLAALGLAVVAETHGWALDVLRYVGAAWLIWLGWKLIVKPVAPIEAVDLPPASKPWKAFLIGGLLNLGNPKAALFYMAIFPGFFDMAALTWVDVLAILAVTLPIGLGSDLAYAFGAAKARGMLKNTKTIRRVNRATGGVMAGAGAAIAAG